MVPTKTDKGRTALAQRDGALRHADRAVLILCDGVRSDAAIRALLGDGAGAALERLAALEYLQAAVVQTAPPRKPVALASVAVAPSIRAVPAAAVKAPAVPAVTVVTPPAAAPAGPRRSLVASKMYAVGLLQSLRDPAAVGHLAAVQNSSDEAALVSALCEMLAYLADGTSGSYAERVAARLDEVLPENHRATLQACWDACVRAMDMELAAAA